MPHPPTVTDFDVKDGFISCFRFGVKCCSYFYHTAFLEICKTFNVFPNGLQLNKTPFISFINEELSATWEDTIKSTQEQLLETLLMGIVEKLTNFEIESTDMEEFSDWLVKLMVHLEKLEKDTQRRKKRKLRKIMKEEMVESALERFDEHCEFFDFKKSLYGFAETVNGDIPNLVMLKLLGSSFMEESVGGNETTMEIGNNSVLINDSQTSNEQSNEQSNACEIENNRYIGKFVSSNVVNISKRNLTSDEISLLSKGLKFVRSTKLF